jgi:hypothetical protein
MRNTDPTFVGIPALIAQHAAQIAAFEAWAAAGDWMRFHVSHYDWWTFPIDRPSQHGLRYTVYADDVAQLKADPGFMTRYRRGIVLVAASWGWDVHRADFIPEPAPEQRWQHWPVRLHKAGRSARLFGEDALYESLRRYALWLIDRGEPFMYNGYDLSATFR